MRHSKEVPWGRCLPALGSVGPVPTMRVKLHTVENAGDIDGPVPTVRVKRLFSSGPMKGGSFTRSSGSVENARAPQVRCRAGSGVPVRQDAAKASLSVWIHWVSFSLGSIVKG